MKLHTIKMKPYTKRSLLALMIKDGAEDRESMIDALSDGNYLDTIGCDDQELVDELCADIQECLVYDAYISEDVRDRDRITMILPIADGFCLAWTTNLDPNPENFKTTLVRTGQYYELISINSTMLEDYADYNFMDAEIRRYQRHSM